MSQMSLRPSGFEDDDVRRVTTVCNSPASQSSSIKILELDSLTGCNGAISDMASAAASDPSYPPFLDGGAVIPSVSPIATAKEPLEIPVIDLANLEPNRIGDACRSPGIFRVTNHGLPEGLSAQIQAEARRILELPFERKRDDLSSAASGGRPVVYFWGTPAINLRLPSLNWLEGLHMPVSGIRSWDSGEWSAGLGFSPSFRILMQEYEQHMARIVQTIFVSLSLDLKLDPSLSECCLHESQSFFRFYRYPCLPHAQTFLGMDAHTDTSVLTVLNEDDVGGLQILYGNRWFDVRPVADTLLVNVGDIMQAISNDEYGSVKHRVVASAVRERISICYFAFPQENFRIRSSIYRVFTLVEYRAQVQDDIKETGDKVGLHRFRM